jgi:hypothetical protein
MATTGNRHGLGGDRLDHPSVTHRLNAQATPTPARDQQAAASPDPKALHRHLVEGTATGTGQHEVAPAVGGEVPAVKRPDDPPAPGRRKELAHRGVASPLLPQHTRLRERPGRRGQAGGELGASGYDLQPAALQLPSPLGGLTAGLVAAIGAIIAATSMIATSRLAARNRTPEAAVPRWLGRLHHHASCCAPSEQQPGTCPREHRQPANRSAPPIWPDASLLLGGTRRSEAHRGKITKASGTLEPAPRGRGWVTAMGSKRHPQVALQSVTLALVDCACGPADLSPRWGGLRVCRLDRPALAPRARPSTPVRTRFEVVAPWQPASSPPC